MDEVRYYNSPITLEEAEQYIQSGLITAARAYVANGYYLHRIREDKLFEEAGYQNFEDYVRGKYNKDKGWASKCIKVNQQLSEGGDSPILSKQYLEYSTYQLVELAYMTEEQREEAAPDMTVNQLKQIRKPEEAVEPEKSCDVATSEPDEEQDREQREIDPVATSEELETVPKESIRDQQSDESLKQNFSSTPLGCPYRELYSCTIPVENRSVPGDGSNCGSSCCWACKFHGTCKLECNASAGRNGEIPKYDAAWFVKEWALRSGDLTDVLRICREGSSNADRAKAVQEYISPYGARCRSCSEYSFSYNSFAGGMDFRIGKVEIHLKYGRLVQELSVLYPDFEEPESVSDQPGPAPEPQENVIDGEFVEVPSEQETPEYTPQYFLEEQKEKLDKLLRISAGKELLPADIKIIECQKTIVAALACMVAELENPESEQEPNKQEQPELSILKNNDQRAAFVDAYETWPLWIETKETGELYYRYDLPDETSIVVKVYHARIFDYHVPGSYEDKYKEGWGEPEYYLLKDGKFFRNCRTSRPDLIEKLKELQKKGKDKNHVEN